MDRRVLLRRMTALPLLAAGSAVRAEDAPAPTTGRALTRAEFMEYVTLFNKNDPGFIRFYHDDVVLELSNAVIRTAQGIRDFYMEVKAHIHEKVEVGHFVSDPTGIAAELPTEFR